MPSGKELFMELPDWVWLRRYLDAEREKRVKRLVQGVNHEEYLRLSGEIAGIEVALVAPTKAPARSA